MSNFGYFSYYISSDGFVIPFKIYSSLASAKKCNNNYKLVKGVWVIVPLRYAFDNTNLIKYMYMNGVWSSDIDDSVANYFYKWRNR